MNNKNIQFNFKGKIVLVTASSQGIGFGIAKSFHEAGASVCICSRDKKQVENAVKIIGTERILGLVGDIGKVEFLKTLVTRTKQHFGSSIDILVNNNGGPAFQNIADISLEKWNETLQTNLLSTISLSTLVLPGMREKKRGRIINMTSTVAKEPEKGMALSSVTRSGVVAFTKTLSREEGPQGITANVILTGSCLTDRLKKLIKEKAHNSSETIDEALKRITKDIPVQFIPNPAEFSKPILFLASEEAGFINGIALPLDGGSSKSIF